MKQIVNIKKLLKATIALSAFVLVGCADGRSDDYYWNYEQTPDTYDQPLQNEEEIFVEEDIFIEENASVEEEFVLPCEEERKTQASVSYKAKDGRSVAASSPAKPRVVPTKPANKCIESQTVDCPFAKKETKSTPEIKQKPQVAPTPAKAVIETPAPIPTVKPVIATTVVEKTQTVKEEKTAPVVETIIENGSENQNPKEKEFTIIDDMITEDTAVIIDLPDDMAQLEAQKAAEEEARLKAEEEAKLAEIKAAQEAERLRLQKEMETLEAQRKALEEEKIKITQIQRNAPESCEDVKDWVAAEGTTLRSLLLEWGDRVGWRVVWNMDRDYTLEAGAVFRGRFVDVAAALLRSFARATPAPKGTFYKGNKVLVISTREDENAD